MFGFFYLSKQTVKTRIYFYLQTKPPAFWRAKYTNQVVQNLSMNINRKESVIFDGHNQVIHVANQSACSFR